MIDSGLHLAFIIFSTVSFLTGHTQCSGVERRLGNEAAISMSVYTLSLIGCHELWCWKSQDTRNTSGESKQKYIPMKPTRFLQRELGSLSHQTGYIMVEYEPAVRR